MLMALAAAIVMSCGTTRTVPITGRKFYFLVCDVDVLSLSNYVYTLCL